MPFEELLWDFNIQSIILRVREKMVSLCLGGISGYKIFSFNEQFLLPFFCWKVELPLFNQRMDI